jgi:tRNA-Thr(GGU) m(6)t(6)A37 methyltransferase TsaA
VTGVFELRAIGTVASPLTDPGSAPKQGHEGAPEAVIAFDPSVAPALDGLGPGDDILVLTWLHLADRDVLRCHPRDDEARPERGVFSTRSSHRPNPIGVHPVEIIAIEGPTVRVRSLEAIDGTPSSTSSRSSTELSPGEGGAG